MPISLNAVNTLFKKEMMSVSEAGKKKPGHEVDLTNNNYAKSLGAKPVQPGHVAALSLKASVAVVRQTANP